MWQDNSPPLVKRNWFDPTPQQVRKSLDSLRIRVGENSAEYAAMLVQLGDSHMRQGLLSNPNAQASYEYALQIFRAQGEETADTAWLYDRLAIVKQSSGDHTGAEADLAHAMKIWSGHPPRGTAAPAVTEDYVARRQEDLANMIRVNEFYARKPPPLPNE